MISMGMASWTWRLQTAEHSVSVLLGNGDGTFQADRGYSSGSDVSVAMSDFNGVTASWIS